MKKFFYFLVMLCIAKGVMAQPDVPADQWTGKTIMLIGAHPDDDTYSQGTLAMLQEHGNEIYIVTLTTGNVGTQDTTLSMTDLALIRKQEELAALKELGIPGDHYINLGYDDGMLEYQNKKDVVANLVRQIRKIRPDVLFAFDPGKGCQRWHKADHRSAAYLAADAARAAMWPLLFQGQITMEGLKAFTIPEYMFYDSDTADINTWVDISKYVDKKINAMSKYVSQWSSGWYKYTGPVLSQKEEKQVKENLTRRIRKRNGVAVEGFRYYKGLPDNIGR
ncbi:MAG: PIG-L family deacetylase [Bacteroidales bacterium]|nr:PIG-L family deacetylase [Bacteroidales bacterium]